MATLKVYSREYGIKKIETKVGLAKKELLLYMISVVIVVGMMYSMFSYYSLNYSLNQKLIQNDRKLYSLNSKNEEQRIIINNLSSYERIKEIAEVLGMESKKDNVKVVR